MYGKVIWSSGKRIASVFNNWKHNIRREAGYRIIKRTLLKEVLLDNPVGRVAGIGDMGGELFSKSSVAISPLRVRDLEENVMG